MKTSLRANSSAGFTIIELLLALMLSAAILSGVYSIIYGAAKGWKSVRADCDRYQTVRAIYHRLATDLECSIPLQTIPFSGDETQVSFPVILPLDGYKTGENVKGSMVNLVSYSFIEKNGKKVVSRHLQPLSPDRSNSIEASDEDFSGDIIDIKFSYPYQTPEGLIWRNDWNNQTTVPDAVRIDLSLRESPQSTVSLQKVISLLHGKLGQLPEKKNL